jgi:hypothetical protein
VEGGLAGRGLASAGEVEGAEGEPRRVTAADSEDGERGMGILVSLPSKPAVFETFETICRQIALIPTATPNSDH